MTHDELIEAVAKAICEADKPNFEKRERWPIIGPVLQAQFKGIARAAISVIAPAVLDEAAKAIRTTHIGDKAAQDRALKTRYE